MEMGDRRIIAIALDERTIVPQNADTERQRSVALRDLLAENSFRPCHDPGDGYDGPYRVSLGVEDGRLAIAIAREDGTAIETLILGMMRFRRVIRDYFAICDSYDQAVRQQTPRQIETIDMARRGLHNDAAQLLIDRLDGKVAIDFDTARRLFTLICVLRVRA